ncbi:MAG TPA: nucleotidyl transferase AbiEii/AbiGii toxin family protein [Wenzhouxiangella sp.]
MIPRFHIDAWTQHAPWATQHQIEQDLIISRALIEIFSNSFLAGELRFRGGTALNKLHFPEAMRYSEDIDLVRTKKGPIKDVLGTLQDLLRPWLGDANYKTSPVAPKLIYSVKAEDGTTIRLKVEINTRERAALDGHVALPYQVQNPWFSGACHIPTFSNDEMLATKLRALLQRDKGRDLFDLSHALSTLEPIDPTNIIRVFGHYTRTAPISRAQAEQRIFSKLANGKFLLDMRPLARLDRPDAFGETALHDAFIVVFNELISRIHGEPWANTGMMRERFKI